MIKLILSILFLTAANLCNAQDDVYDSPEPVIPPRVYAQSNQQDNYENTANQDNSYNPNFDYQYRRNLRRMYDPYYVMPSSAYMNMYSYPQFNSYYSPYAGNGFSISIGNSWGNGWNSGYNSYNSWANPYSNYGYNDPWGYSGFNNYGYSNYGYNNYGWNGMGCNSWFNGWNSPYYSNYGWNSNPGYYRYNNYGYGNYYNGNNYNGNSNNYRPQQNTSNVQLPERRLPRPNRDNRYGGNTGAVFSSTPDRPLNTGSNNSSNSGSNNQTNTNTHSTPSWNSNSNRPSTPDPAPSNNNTNTNSAPPPTRTEGTIPRSGRF
jgi:hypothetical protein